MDEEKLDELTADIRAKGVLVPIIVAQRETDYEVIAGHRRRLAAARAGLASMPCVVYASRDAALEAVKWSENRYREDLNAAEEAVWFGQLLERDCGGDVDRLCEQLGAKRGYVEGRLLLLQLDERVFEALEQGKIKIGVAQALAKCTDEQYRRMLLHQAVVGGATVSIVNGWVTDWQLHIQPIDGQAQPPAPAIAPSAIPQTNFFTCVCCGGTDNVHRMVPVNVHDYCKLAILDKLLAAYHGDDGGGSHG
jgi:ParB family chromosome partitioning protein